jgi:hypothetical protein
MVTLTRRGGTANGKVFIIHDYEIVSKDDAANSDSVELKFPKDGRTDESSFRISLGVTTQISLNVRFLDRTTDRADGTHTSEVETYKEIMNYLKGTFFDEGLDEISYELEGSSKFEDFHYYVYLEGFSDTTGSDIYPSVNIKFRVDRAVS